MVEVESIFEGNNKKKYKSVMLRTDLIDKLKKLNKGSHTRAIEHLLNINPETNVINQIKSLNGSIGELQERFERLIKLNPSLRL
jgi:hypothetical protein